MLVVLAGIAGRALIDKMLALRGGPDAVAVYAQLASLSELVSTVSLAGIGVALVAVVARAESTCRVAWLRVSLMPCLLLSGVAALGVLPFIGAMVGSVFPAGMEGEAALAILVGWLVVAPTLILSCLIGMSLPGLAALWTSVSFVLPLGALAWLPFSPPVNVLLGQGVFGLLAMVGIAWQKGMPIDRREVSGLLRFAPVGIAIGILSPVGMLLARTRIAEVSGWELVAHAQSVWRANDWVLATVAGLLYVHFLPRFAASESAEAFWRELRAAAATLLLPAAVLSAGIGLFLPEIVTTLYRADMAPVRGEGLWLLAGDWLRVLSWLFLYGLYARQAARAVMTGELLSLPLFALLLWFCIQPISLASIGQAWAAAYLVYALFNGLALRRSMAAGRRTG